jgi:hypothetical protein
MGIAGIADFPVCVVAYVLINAAIGKVKDHFTSPVIRLHSHLDSRKACTPNVNDPGVFL